MMVFFNYIVSPITTLSTSFKAFRLWHSIVALFVFSLFWVFQAGQLTVFSVLVQFLFTIVILLIGVAIVDVGAQLLKKGSAAVLLFKCMAMSLMLWIYIHPLELLSDYFSSVVLVLLYILFFFVIFRVQLVTIKIIYGVGTVQAFVLLLFPTFLFVGSILLSALSLISLS